MAEWITIRAAARAAGYSTANMHTLRQRGIIPSQYVRWRKGGYIVNVDVIPLLIEHKRKWHAAVKQPEGVIHVPDPLGIQEGLWLTPDEAQRLLAIRELHRRYPTAQERNKAMESDG